MDRDPQLIAVSEREDLGARARPSCKRIVGGNLAVFAQAQHLAVHGIELLRLIAERRPGRHVDQTVGSEGETRSTRARIPVTHEQILDAGERLAVKASPRQRDGALPLCWIRARLACLVVGEVDDPVRRELRMQRNLLQAAATKRGHRRHAGHRLGIEPGTLGSAALKGAGRVVHDPQPRSALGHQRVAVGKKGEAEGVRQSSGDHHHANLVLLGGVERVRPVNQDHRSDPDLRLPLLGPCDWKAPGGPCDRKAPRGRGGRRQDERNREQLCVTTMPPHKDSLLKASHFA